MCLCIGLHHVRGGRFSANPDWIIKGEVLEHSYIHWFFQKDQYNMTAFDEIVK